MLPIGLGLAGLALLGSAGFLLRSLGQRYRIARLLAAAPEAAIAEARALALGPPHFVRVHGRVQSDEEFPDEHERPLVYRRRRLEVQRPSGAWEPVEDDRVAVPFAVGSRSTSIAVDADGLGDGLVVMPRESSGRASEVPGRLPPDLPPATPVRLRVEQVSAVEQATIAGVPRIGPDGEPWLTTSATRPLILTTLEVPTAMRLLADGRRRRVTAAVACLVGGAGMLAAAIVAALLRAGSAVTR